LHHSYVIINASEVNRKTKSQAIKGNQYFSLRLRRKVQHINRILAAVLLMVFTIALTPFNLFHHHHEAPEQKCYADGQTKCVHKEHLQNHADNCLICAAHFEKNYTVDYAYHWFFSTERPFTRTYKLLSGSYVELIGSSLRGPPLG
jgi:hypothetical protein